MEVESSLPRLIEAARQAAAKSYSPYSKFAVGAAVLTKSGTIFAATNIENASYGLTICAERNAVFHAVCAGQKDIAALALFTPTDEIYTPCGACRQVLAEFLEGDAPVICVANEGVQKALTVDELLPMKFSL